MRNFKVIVLAAGFLLLSACASVDSKPTGNNAKAQAKTPALPQAVYVSMRKAQPTKMGDCPNSDKSWKKEPLKNLVQYANFCAQMNQWPRVEQLGDWMAQREPSTAWGAFYLSMAAESRKEWPRAVWMIELALKKAPREALLLYQKGRIHWGMGEYRTAVENYNLAVQENPRFADAQLFLGQLYYRDQDFSKAAKHFSIVRELEPDNLAATVGLAETRLATGDQKAAITLYEQAVNLSPRQLSYRFKLAGLYETASKNYAQALTTYKRLKTLLVETRAGADEVPVDVNEKIRSLEVLVQKQAEPERKVSQEASVKKVKK